MSSLRTRARRLVPRPAKRLATTVLEGLDPIAVARYRGQGAAEGPGSIPPRRLRARVGQPNVAAFVRDGAEAALELKEILDSIERPLGDFGFIYELGCGPGRVLTRLATGEDARRAGSDVDSEAVSWLAREVPYVEAAVNPTSPPAPFESGRFDLVYAISVFTHLNEASQFAWLREVARLLSPDGVGVLTIHGPATHAAFLAGHRRGTSQEWQRRLRSHASLDDEGFIYEPEHVSRWDAWRYRGVESDYGNSFHSHDYVRERWSEVLDVEAIRPESINWRQDAVVVRKKREIS